MRWLPILLAGLCGVAGAETPPAESLDQARQEIREIKRRLDANQQRQLTLEEQLARQERRIGELTALRLESSANLAEQEELVQRMARDYQKKEAEVAEQRARLAALMRGSYMMGRQERLRVLLNQRDPRSLNRSMVYVSYLAEARLRRIASLRESIRQLDELQQLLGAEKRQLAQLLNDQTRDLKRLQQEKARRLQLLGRLRQQQGEDRDHLRELEQDLQRMRDLLARLQQEQEQRELARREEQRRLAEQRRLREQQALAEQRVAAERAAAEQARKAEQAAIEEQAKALRKARAQPLAERKGQLPQPVKGRVLAAYGSAREGSSLRWDGILFGAEAGTSVHAVHAGEVVFADWLKGMGLLLILDHDDGYLTLYGHNEALLKRVGDRVAAGEVIATVGLSGGRSQPALYFSLRRHGRPVNPGRWFQAALGN